jgi:methionine biosynthesis protein MetW
MIERLDWQIIEEHIKEGTSVLDLGCGDGELLYRLKKNKNIIPYGVEIEEDSFVSTLEKGIPIIKADIDNGLKMFRNTHFDYVIISETLQQLKNPCKAMEIALEIGKEVIISFINFGYYKIRAELLFLGKIPKRVHKPYSWYNTPNIHLFTLKDFLTCCKERKIHILKRILISKNNILRCLFPNLFSEYAVFFLKKEK